MQDPEYAAKYSKPYKDDKIPRMAKQAIDARFIEGKSGVYIGGGGATEPATGGGEVGIFTYPYSWLETHAGALVLAGTGDQNLFAGATLGMRAQTPSRLAPYFGGGAFAGATASEVINALEEGDDDDFPLPEPENPQNPSKNDDRTDFIAGVFPEAGLHLWLTPSVRLSAGGSYYVTTDGRDSDFWYYGGGISYVFGP
jgi:hypothetical protein